MQEAVLNLIRVSLREHQRTGVSVRTGNQLGKTVPGTTYRCAPGGPNDWVYIYAQPQMWPAVCEVLGRPDLEQNPQYKTASDRWANRAALDAMVTEWTSTRTKHEVMKLMGDATVRYCVKRGLNYAIGLQFRSPLTRVVEQSIAS